MNKSRKRKNLLIVIVLLAIIAIAVGYATMAETLILKGTASSLSLEDWDVHFLSDPFPTMDPTTSEQHDGVFEQSFEFENLLTGKFSVVLAPGASIDYNVQIINDGRLHAIADGEPVVEGETANIKCTVTPITTTDLYTENGTLSGTDSYKVTIKCNDMEELPENPEKAEIKVTFNYKQAH